MVYALFDENGEYQGFANVPFHTDNPHHRIVSMDDATVEILEEKRKKQIEDEKNA